MANEKKRSAVGPDGVADFNCCIHERNGKFGTSDVLDPDAIDVDIKIGSDGSADLYIGGCRHVSSVIDCGPELVREVRVGDKVFIVVVAERKRFAEAMARHVQRQKGDYGRTVAPAPSQA